MARALTVSYEVQIMVYRYWLERLPMSKAIAKISYVIKGVVFRRDMSYQLVLTN